MEKPPLEMTALMELISTYSNLIQNAEAEGCSTLLKKTFSKIRSLLTSVRP